MMDIILLLLLVYLFGLAIGYWNGIRRDDK